MLTRAIKIAVQAHDGQVDKAGKPYILHPLRVMLGVSSEEAMICAVLHDVLEDTVITAEELLEKGFSAEVVKAIQSVTKAEDDENYFDFVRRAKGNPIGRIVKIADLKDNMDRSRIPNPTAEDEARFQKYRAALEILESDI